MSGDSTGSAGRAHWLDNLAKGVQNALEIARVGRLSEPVFQPFTVVHRSPIFRLRHYEPASVPDAQRPDCPLILVPPLMVTSEVYDMSPESSALGYLREHGVSTYVVDFGAPEHEEGGLARTLDDHVLALDEAIDFVRAHTGHDVHLAGYSQGGMFIYQCAALRNSEGIRSAVTFGSPVDVHRNLPKGVSRELASRFVESMSGVTRKAMGMAEGIPAALSRNAFRMMSVGKEIKHFIDFVGNLHDREAIKRDEGRRTFLGGEGFVAWPGPALQTFFEQFIVENRMTSGGFVIAGRTLTLADVTCPILYFVGLNDEFARPPSVRAIREATTVASLYEITLKAGHLGLVVGSRAMTTTWPGVVQWLLFQEQKGPLPEGAIDPRTRPERPSEEPRPVETSLEDVEYNLGLLVDTAKETADSVRRRFEGVSHNLSATFDNLRWQVPRLAKLERIGPDTRVGVGLALAEQAQKIPEHTFFLWSGRAHSYAAADRRVGYVTAGLISCGVQRGDLVGVLMDARPTYLTIVAALSRLGAVSVLIPPGDSRIPLEDALGMVPVAHLVTDPEHAQAGRAHFDGQVLVLGGGAGPRTLVDGVVDMERIDPEAVVLPQWYEPNPGRASELGLVLFAMGKDERPRAARITNHRWAVAAYGAAAASTLTHSDTVYCCMPLYHAAGLLVSVGGALAGGARLALGDGFQPDVFWHDVRRYGASVVYYAGDMCRALVDTPPTPSDANNPVRLFAGSGMRRDVWARLSERFHTDVLEFYATTEGSAVLANVSGKPAGSVGRPLPGSADVAVVQFDFDVGEVIRDAGGWVQRSEVDTPGMMLARVRPSHIAGDVNESRRLVRDAFEPGDAWLMTGDVLRVDAHGNHWFVDRAADMIHTPAGAVPSTRIEDALYELFMCKLAVVYDAPLPGTPHDMPVATLVLREGYQLDLEKLAEQVERGLERESRPLFVRVRETVPTSLSYRPKKHALRAEGIGPNDPDAYAYDARAQRYVPLDAEAYARAVQDYGGEIEAGEASSVKAKPATGRGATVRPKVSRSVPPPPPRYDED